MRSLKPIIASNSLAIALTIVFVLPITAIFAYVVTSPLDGWMAQVGVGMHNYFEWSFSHFDTEERFAKIGFAIRSIFIAVGISFLYFWISNWLNMGLARYSARGSEGKQSAVIEAIQPWIFAGPALVLLLLFLFIPALSTLSISFQEASGELTSRNYAFLWDPAALGYEQFRFAMRNSLMWLILVPTCCISLGLLIAVLADSVRWGVIAKTFIFVPLAISFVGAAVIWRNIFAGGGIQPQEAINGLTPSYQIGLLKALLGHTAAYNEPLYSLQFWGNFFLMWILVWVQTGFAMVIFSAALRGVPEDTIEAATIDGANPFQMFFRIKLPQIYSTVLVVWTTLVILVLKVFDIVFAMTNGQWETQVLANYMYDKLFRANDWGVGSASAMIIMLLVTPILVWNIHNARKEMR